MSLSKRLRFTFHFLDAVIKKYYRLIFLGLIFGVVFYSLAPKIYRLIGQPRKTEKIGLVGQYLVTDIPLSILQDISYGLTTISEKGDVAPALAESWQVTNDGKTYIFQLKTENLFWHDGKKFAPTDVNYNFNDVEVSVEGNNLTFKLKEPFAPFPAVLSKPLFRRGLIGLGTYKVKKIETQGKMIKSILLVPFNDNHLPNKLYRFYNNEDDLKTGFNLGEVNTLNDLLSLDGLFLSPTVKINKTIMNNAYVGLFFNTNLPPFSSKPFRQALAYAIPKETGSQRALTPINPVSKFYNPDVKPYAQDLNHAKEILKDEKIPSDQVITISTFPQFEYLADQIRDSWKQIGISSEVRIISTIPENFQVLIIGREIPKDPDQYSFWHSTQSNNLSGFKNFRIDKLLEDGRRTLDEEERKNIYFDFQRFLVEESPVVFLIHPTVYSVSRP